MTVMAHWEVEVGGLADEHWCIAQTAVVEAITDRNGRFEIPGWGPRYAGCLFGGFSYRSPRILLFKSGYRHWIGENGRLGSSYDYSYAQNSDWNGRTIQMQKFYGKAEDYAKSLRRFSSDLSRFIEKDCLWKKIRLMLRALYRQDQEFLALGYKQFGSPHGVLVANRERYSKMCGSVDEFLDELAK